jgi:hypothetical protein
MASHHLPPDFNLWEWVGAVAGTIISLTYSSPKTRADFIARLVVSVLVGGIFGFIVGDTVGWPDTARHDFAAGAGMAFFSYAAIGVAARTLKNWKLPPKP